MVTKICKLQWLFTKRPVTPKLNLKMVSRTCHCRESAATYPGSFERTKINIKENVWTRLK